MTDKPDIDQGHAWFVLAGCFVMYMFSIGSMKCYGVLYTEMRSYFGASSGATAWIGSVCLFLMLGLGPVANALAVRFTFRSVGFAGGLLVGIGYALCMFIPRIEYMYITFGVIIGVGTCFAFTSSATIISFYFEKHRALANGITVSASGIGALTLPFLYRFLIDTYSLKGTFLVISGLLLHICPAACIFTQPRILRRNKQAAKSTQDTGDHPSEKPLISDKDKNTDGNARSWKPDFRFSLFKNPLFSLYALAFTLCMNGFGNNLILIPSHTNDLGYDKTKVSLSVSIMGGCEVFARIFFGWFADRNIIKRKNIFLFSMLISSVFCFIAPQFRSFEFIAVYAAVVGIFPGSFWSLMPVLVIEAVGMDNFVPAFGLLTLCLAFGAVFSQPVIGWLEDLTGNWNASFYMTGCLLLLAGLVVTLEPFVHKYHREPGKEPEMADDVTSDHVIDPKPMKLNETDNIDEETTFNTKQNHPPYSHGIESEVNHRLINRPESSTEMSSLHS